MTLYLKGNMIAEAEAVHKRRSYGTELLSYLLASIIVCLSASTSGALADPSAKTWALYKQGQALMEKNKYREAVNAFTMAIADHHDFAQGYCQRGHCLFQCEDMDGALSDVDKAIALDPRLAQAYEERAMIMAELGKSRLAIESINKAIALAGRHANWSWFQNRGKLYEMVGDFNKALTDYSETLRRNPINGWGYYNRAAMYYKLGRYQEAISDVSIAVKLHSNGEMIKFYQLRADCYDKVGKHDLAKKDRKYAETNSKNDWADSLIGHP